MERYGRHSDGPQPDPSPEWTAPGTETGLEGKPKLLAFFKKKNFRDLSFYSKPLCVSSFCGFSDRLYLACCGE